MHKQPALVSEELLQSSQKILFITHLNVGGFVYLNNYFKIFHKKYPHIKIDLWIDVRRTRCFWRWERLKKYFLYDWVRQCGLFATVYDQTYSPATFKKSLHQAKLQHYPIVISLAMFRHHYYARLARTISPKGFVVAVKNNIKKYDFFKKRIYKKIDKTLRQKTNSPCHISETYAAWFEQLFGFVSKKTERRPFVAIPNEWIVYAKLRFLKYGIDKKNNSFGKVFFVNIFANNKKRSWPINSLILLIKTLKRVDEWNDISFIVNSLPSDYQRVKKIFDDLGLNKVIVFSAQQNFFQLPAIMLCCDLVISVETAVMHLANAVGVPVVALMWKKNPEWAPFDHENSFVITTSKRSQRVSSIAWQQVVDATIKFAQEKLG